MKLNKIAAASLVAMGLGLGAAGQAQAAAYAYSYNDITNFTINGITTFDAAATTSLASSTHNAYLPGVSNSASMDTLQAYNGTPPIPAENTFSQIGKVGTYGRADAAIWSADVLNGNGAATNAAEGYVEANDLSTGSGSNHLDALWTFTATGAAPISFSMMANPFMYVQLDPVAAPGSVAHAALSFSLDIYDAGTTNIVDHWDPASIGDLNQSINALVVGAPLVHGTLGTYTPYAYTTSYAFVAGQQYQIALSMGEQISTKNVPEPATSALMGLGLAGLGFMAWRRRESGQA